MINLILHRLELFYKHFNEYCCSFTPLCKILCLLSSLFVAGIIAAIITISLIQSKVTTTIGKDDI